MLHCKWETTRGRRRRQREGGERRDREGSEERKKDEWLYDGCAPFNEMINNQSARCFRHHFDLTSFDMQKRKTATGERGGKKDFRLQSTIDCHVLARQETDRPTDNYLFKDENSKIISTKATEKKRAKKNFAFSRSDAETGGENLNNESLPRCRANRRSRCWTVKVFDEFAFVLSLLHDVSPFISIVFSSLSSCSLSEVDQN